MALATEQFRPSLHFAPARNWMNDPNGLILLDGVWHLFFQCNPNGAHWGDIAWGHATSTDLLTWTEHPLAIVGDEHEMIFSGSIVLDEHDGSGLGGGAPVLVAIFTSHFVDHPVHGTRQAQSLASSTDGGHTWTRYPGNPVDDRGRPDYRDPKVFRQDGRWIMVAVEADDSRLVINGSDDLLRWTELSTFTSPRAPGFWECPDLFPIELDGERRWVLHLSTGGPRQVALIGRFDGERFVEDASVPADDPRRLAQHGRDDYAAVTFAGTGERRVMLGWMGHAFDAPTAPWRGIMTLPRELALTTRAGAPRLVTRFARELDAAEAPWTGRGPLRVRWRADAGAGGVRIAAGVEAVVVRVEALDVGYRLTVDRAASGLLPAEGFAEPVVVGPEVLDVEAPLEVDLVVDAMSIEVVAGGALVSELLFPSAPLTEVESFGAVHDLRVTGFRR